MPYPSAKARRANSAIRPKPRRVRSPTINPIATGPMKATAAPATPFRSGVGDSDRRFLTMRCYQLPTAMPHEHKSPPDSTVAAATPPVA